ncbi:MAG: SH3 domain-containing protein [Nostoc sp. NMS7]|uniref:SH3 domain-containing protein n=1 Tax=Nostoc sp. NMS7 TaxID=2815391 RepID=UPI0025E32449|nr:SH3 domain-containing protein [Nostoc sp. NMS7]MBN3945922.1 SH3 domain-containing protein [Nostoc sp. NMS7]
MKNHKLMVSAVILALATAFTSFPAKAEVTVCKITDPTGTPLNLRIAPNEQITGTVKNGTEVYIYEIVPDEKGRQWAKVGFNGFVWGWVFREFISCY